MKRLILLIFCCPFLTGHAQTPDSFWNIYMQETLPDTTRLESLHEVFRHYLYRNPDTAMYFAKLEQQLAESINDSTWIGTSYNAQGMALAVQGELTGGLDRFSRSRDIRLALNDTIGLATAYNNIGNIYYYKGDFIRALDNYIRSTHYEELLDNKSGMAGSLLNIGSIYAHEHEYSSALDYFNRALELYIMLGDSSRIGDCYANLGTVYKSLDSIEMAKSYLEKSAGLLERAGSDKSLGAVYSNLGDISGELGDVERMLALYEDSERVRKRIGDKLGLINVKVHKGMAYLRQGQFRPALEQCQVALDSAGALGVLHEMRDACYCLYEIYKVRGNQGKALEYYEQYEAVEDSLKEQETRKRLQLMEFRKQVAQDSIQREEEKTAIAAVHATELRKVERRRNGFMVAGVLFLFLSAVFYVIARRTRRSKKVIEQQKSRTDSLLLNILPQEVASELLETGKLGAREFEHVTVLFTDFVGFTSTSQDLRPQDLIEELNTIFTAFDAITEQYGIKKIKTIGDAYMAAGGLPAYEPETVVNSVDSALAMQAFLTRYNQGRRRAGLPEFKMRVGLHHGPVVAGIVGKHNFQYDIWGDTVNLASRLESDGASDLVNISRAVYDHIADSPKYRFEQRGLRTVKGGVSIEMWFVAWADQAVATP